MANIAEGKWYAEIKRTRKHGKGYDWKTQLNSLVMEQIASGNRSSEMIDKLIYMFDFTNPTTIQVLELLDSYEHPTAPVNDVVLDEGYFEVFPSNLFE